MTMTFAKAERTTRAEVAVEIGASGTRACIQKTGTVSAIRGTKSAANLNGEAGRSKGAAPDAIVAWGADISANTLPASICVGVRP